MGRRKRIWLPNYFYHIVCRGNRRDALFNDKHDFLTYLYILRQIYDRYPFEIASYCLMTNHLHLQLMSPEQPISKIMSLVNKRYADYYNTKYKMTGHVYEKRYFDKIIPDPIAMLEVSRYIHLNPLEAQMVLNPEDYRWSSYRHFSSEKTTKVEPFFNTNRILDYFPGTDEEKKLAYCEFVEK
ncbi:transposase [Bacillaceae bacterium S4-13-58]